MNILEAFREGGFFMYVVVGVALLASLVSITALGLALTRPTRQPGVTIGIVALVVSAGVPITGVVGYAIAMQQVFQAVSHVDPSLRAAILAQGISEAMNLIVFGGLCGALPFVLACTAIVRAALRAPSPR